MSELLQAAKAVIDAEDIPTRCNAISKLRAAVERTEKQESVGFAEWWDKNADLKYKFVPIGQAKQLWNDATTAATQAERERIKNIIREVTDGFGNCDRLMEKIDATNE